jgi:hypothetical protein
MEPMRELVGSIFVGNLNHGDQGSLATSVVGLVGSWSFWIILK